MLRTDLIAPIPELLRRHATARGEKCAFRDAQSSVTYAELYERTGKLASALAAHGVASNDTVAIILPNSVQWVESCFAIARAGAVSVPISYDSTEAEIAYRLNDANCRAIITTAERGDMLAKLQASAPNAGLLIVTDRGSLPRDGVALRRSDRRAAAVGAARSRFPQRNLLHSLYLGHDRPRQRRSAHRTRHVVGRGRLLVTHHRPVRQAIRCCRRCRCFTPTRSIYRCSSILATGASEYIMEKFSTSEALRLLKSGEFTFFPGVPTMFHYLLQTARSEREGDPSKSAALRFRRRHHAGDPQPRIRGSIQHPVA